MTPRSAHPARSSGAVDDASLTMPTTENRPLCRAAQSKQVGVVVHAAMLDEDGLLNAVRVHLVDQSLDRLEPACSRVSMRGLRSRAVTPEGMWLHDTRAGHGLTTRGNSLQRTQPAQSWEKGQKVKRFGEAVF